MLLLLVVKLNTNVKYLTKSRWIGTYRKINFAVTCPERLEMPSHSGMLCSCLKTVLLAHLDVLAAVILYPNTCVSIEIVLAAFFKVTGRH